MDYTELDPAARLVYVQNRVRDLESQHQQLSLRVDAPAPGEIISQQDRENLAALETSLTKLHELATQLTASETT